jgi:hypothetical protein
MHVALRSLYDVGRWSVMRSRTGVRATRITATKSSARTPQRLGRVAAGGFSIWLSPIKPFPYTQSMEKLSKVFVAVFTTKFLASIACFLAGVLLMQGLGNYYGFNWISALAAQ